MLSPTATATRTRFEGHGGAIAALLALFLDLTWRTTVAPAGVPSIPETIVAAIARLTPTSFFGWATENLGSTAQNTLWALVLLGTVGVGYLAGQSAGRWVASGRLGTGPAARSGAGAIVGGVLFLIVAGAVFPVAREGFFAAGSANQATLLAQAALFAAIWALVWVMVGLPAEQATGATAVGADADLSRRSALRGVAAAGLAAGIAYLGWRLAKAPAAGDVVAQKDTAAEIAARARLDEPALEPSGGFAAQGATPEPAAAAEVPGDANPEALFAELEADGKLTPVITSVADFYHVSKNISDPVVDGESWSLTVGGMVANPLTLTYDDVLNRANMRNITTLGCISNELNGDLAGTAEWTGFPLRELLEEAGINPATVDVVFRAADGYDDSVPFAVAMDPTTLVVTAMNGDPLPPDHGYPARLIIPPIYGMKNVKWIEQIEAVDTDYKGYWQTRGWSDPAPYQIWGRIDTPASGEEIAAGPAVAAGVASAGDRGILRVEMSLDEGATWGDATLEPSINPNFTWVRWVFPFEAQGPEVNLLLRATDGEGNVAPQEYRSPLPDGATGWPQRSARVA
jgi:DMSO/TMAO reductase YedYZ molybdopterin-dependent catalytic subunit